MDPVIPNAIPEGCCVFCDSPSQAVERYGKFLHHEESGIHAHYYCMLFACGLSQRGETNEGIEGFLIKDILAERKRAQKLKCKYCKKKGASVGCSVRACHQIYHYGCGVDEGAIYLFYDSFVSYCVKHRPVQKVLPSSCSPSKGICPICMDNVETTPGNSVLKTPCCKGTWLHRDCVQMQALSAGYFFRCAICNNENEFQDEMKKFGIYLPEKDADWEFGGNAYQELYERHNRCDVDKCRCPKGRKYATQSGQWEVVLCDLCGSAGCHIACGGLVTALDDWACRDCTSTFTRGFMEQNSSTSGGSKEKFVPSLGSPPTRTPVPGGTRVRSAIRSQGKRPRPPPTTPRPLKKTKHSSSPLCPPLSPVSSQQSSLSSSPKSTPCETMKFPRVSLSPTREWEVCGPGSSKGSGVGKFGEFLPTLDCYVALESTSHKVYYPNLSMPSLSPAGSSTKKRKSGNKLKYKKARKLDLTSSHLYETNTTQIDTSTEGKAMQAGNTNSSAPAVIGSQSGEGKESTTKPSWGSRLLDSVGSFLWRKSPSKHKEPESSEGNQKRKAIFDNDDTQKSSFTSQQDNDIGNSSIFTLDSVESSPPSSASPIALSEEVKAQIIPVTSDNIPTKTKNMLHDLTSWKDDSTWKEAKQDLAHLFQVDGRATRSALKKDMETPVKTPGKEKRAMTINKDAIHQKPSLQKEQSSDVQRKTDVETPIKTHGKEKKAMTINKDAIRQKPSLQKEQVSDVQRKSSNHLDHTFTHQLLISPVVLSEEIRAQIIPVTSDNIPTKTKNLLHDLTSWKDDSTWKEASPIALSEEVKAQIIPVTSDNIPTKTKNMLHDLTSWKDDSTWKEAKQDLAHLFQVDGRATRSALKKDVETPIKTTGKEKKALIINKQQASDVQRKKHVETTVNISGKKIKVIKISRGDIPQKTTLQKEQPSDVQIKLSKSHDKVPFSPAALSEEVKAQIIPVTSDNIPTKTKNLLHDLTSWKDDSTWKEAKQDLAHLFQVDGRATRSTLKKEGATPAKGSGKGIKTNSSDSVLIDQKSPLLRSLLASQSKLDSFDSSHQDSNSPKVLLDGTDTQILPLPTEGQSSKGKHLLKDLTSWKDDTTWKEAKNDLAHLFHIDGRVTRRALKKDEGQMTSSTALCSPSKKKRKLERSLSQNTSSPAHLSGKGKHKMRNLSTGRFLSQKSSMNELDREEEFLHASPASNDLITIESGEIHGQQRNVTQEHHPHACVEEATGSIQLSVPIRQEDDVLWKKPKGDPANLSQVSDRTPRSVRCKHGEPESSTSTTEDDTTFEIHGISILNPLKQIDQFYQKHDVGAKTGRKDSQEAILQHEASSPPAPILQRREPYKPETDEGHPFPLESTSNLRGGKNVSHDVQKLTAWKGGETWKEFREDMAVLLQVDGRTTRNKAKKDGLTGISGSPKVLGKKTISSSIRKGQNLPSMTVLERIVSANAEMCLPNHKMHASLNASLDIENPSSNALAVPSNEIRPGTTCDASPYSVRDIGKEPTIENRKSRKRLSKVFHLDHNAEVNMKHNKVSQKSHCDIDFEMPSSKIDWTLIDMGADKTSNSLQEQAKPIMLDHSSQTKASKEEVDAYISSMGLWYKEPNYLPPPFKTHGNHRTGYTQTYNSKYEKHHTDSTATMDQSASNEENRVDGELKGMSASICRSLVDETLGNAMKQSQGSGKRTEHELLREWTKKDLWKEAKEDLQTILNAEERITRSCRKKPKETKMAEGPESGSSTPVAKPSPSLDLRKRKYCCSHMRSPWKASPAKNKATRDGISTDPEDLQQYSPVFRKQLHHSKAGKDSKTLSNLPGGKGDTLASMNKIWKPKVLSSVDCARKDERTITSLYSSNKFGVPKLHNGKTRKEAASKEYQKCSPNKIGRPGNQTLVTSEPEKSGTSKEPQDSLSEMKRDTDVTHQKKIESPSKQMFCTPEKKAIGMPRNRSVHVTQQKKSETSPQQVLCTSEKKKLGRARKLPVDVSEQEKSETPPQTGVCTSEKKKVGRPRKLPDDATLQDRIGNPPNQEPCTSEKKMLGRPRKHPDDVNLQEKIGSSPNQEPCTSEKKKLGRPWKHTDDVTEQEKSETPQPGVCTSEKKKLRRPKKHSDEGTLQEKMNSPPEREPCTSEKKKLRKPRKHQDDVNLQEKIGSVPNQEPCSSEEKKVGGPKKHSDEGTLQEKMSSPPNQEVCTSEKKKIGRPRKHSINTLGQKSNYGNASKPPKNAEVSVASDMEQSCQGSLANSRRIGKARRRLESSSIHPTTIKTIIVDNEVENCFKALQKDRQAGQIETRNFSTQTDASVEEVETYVASRGKFYLEPCFLIPRPNLDKTKGTSDMRTQTYNLNLSHCLDDEIKLTCPPLVYNEANRPPSTRKKTKSKCKMTPPSLNTLEKVSNASIAPSFPAASSPVTSSIPFSSKIDSSSQTKASVEEVEAFIESMGEWYREPSIIVTRSQETIGEVKHSIRTQTYNLSLPDRELPMFKKKWSKRVRNQMNSTQTKATLDEVNAYIDQNKQLYTDPKYSTIQSYSVIGSSLMRHIPTQTYSFNHEEETSDAFCEFKGIPESDQTSPTENTHNSCIESQVKPIARNDTEERREIDRPSHQQGKLDQSLNKPITKDHNVTGTGTSKITKANSITSGHEPKKQNWFRIKPKK